MLQETTETIKFALNYNTGNPKLTLSGLSVTNWIGQAYRDTNDVLEFTNGTNSEGTSGATIQTLTCKKSYSFLKMYISLVRM